MIRYILKPLKQYFKKKQEPVFAIRKITTGKMITYLPVIKEQGIFNKWTPIVKIYDIYIPLDFEKENGLTYQECKDHIYNYKKQLNRQKEFDYFSMDYEIL